MFSEMFSFAWCFRFHASLSHSPAGLIQGSNGCHTLQHNGAVYLLVQSFISSAVKILPFLKNLFTQPLSCGLPRLTALVCSAGLSRSLFLNMNNDVREVGRSERPLGKAITQYEFSSQSNLLPASSVGLLFRWHDNLSQPLFCTLSAWGLGTQLQACAIWAPVFDRLQAEQGCVQPQ